MTATRLQWAVVAAAVLIAGAFFVSFILGLRSDAPVPDAVRERDIPGLFSGKRVEVLNASAKPGLARQATQLLRDAGFDVVYFGNATSTSRTSVVLDRVGKLEVAQGAGRTLGISSVATEKDSTRMVEASVVLGSDWAAPVKNPPR